MKTLALYPPFACLLSILAIHALASTSISTSTVNVARRHPERRANTVVVRLAGGTTVTGKSKVGIESFNGIPYARPPVGPLRLRPPVEPESLPRNIDGTKPAPACPQMLYSTRSRSILDKFAPALLRLPFLRKVNGQEDCLTVDVARPAGTKAGDKLPVLFWIYGGGFSVGSTKSYDGAGVLRTGVKNKQPFLYVAVTYRLGGFGFLPGKEVLKSGNSNLGLLDQRLGLKWVADNIEAFGDPSRVTLWGESAGAMSVFNHMLLYGGNASYHGKPLFRGAIMNSGTMIPSDPLDSPQAQLVYDTVVKETGCSSAQDTLMCLREAPYSKYLEATRTLPTLFSFNSVAISYFPRPDGEILEASPEVSLRKGRFLAVPAIFGNQEDEGTLFSMDQRNVTTADDMVAYLSKNLFPHVPQQTLKELVDYYEPALTNGSPFGTGILNELYPGYKRISAVFGDSVFTGMRRAAQNMIAAAKPQMPFWSYHATFDHGFPIYGTFHGSDIFQLFSRGVFPNHYILSCRTYYLNFLYNLDPNKGVESLDRWPLWREAKELMWFKSRFRNGIIKDDFRAESLQWVEDHVALLHQ